MKMNWQVLIKLIQWYYDVERTHPSLGKLWLISTWWWLNSSAVFALNTCGEIEFTRIEIRHRTQGGAGEKK